MRYTLEIDKLPVIGVAFTDPNNDRHTQAAILSITEVPGTQVIYRESEADEVFVGSDGFYRACVLAATKELPILKIPTPRPPMDLDLESAIATARG